MSWNEPLSRESAPEARAFEQADAAARPTRLSAREWKLLESTWRRLRRHKPHLYAVLKACTEALGLEDDVEYESPRLYRGFYAHAAYRNTSVESPTALEQLYRYTRLGPTELQGAWEEFNRDPALFDL